VISRRFVKKQQMRWQPESVHTLAPPGAHPDAQRYPARNLSRLVARNGDSFSLALV